MPGSSRTTRGTGTEGRGKGDEGKASTLRLFPVTAGWGMVAAVRGRPNLKWQRCPGRIPSSTGPLLDGPHGVRMES
jgi:hypothetical protein